MTDLNTNTTSTTTSTSPVAETNPLKALEAKAKRAPRILAAKTAAKPAAKSVAKSAKAAPKGTDRVKFEGVFTATFTEWLLPHGFRQVESTDPRVVVFAKNGTKVAITNPSMPGGSKFAEWVVTRKSSSKKPAGKGRDALADELKIAKFTRS
jgi:hypothetical protein